MPNLPARKEFHTPKPAGSSAQVETSDHVRITTPEKVCGMGHRMKRKEDPRFLQGKGNYVDDVKLPHVVYMDIVRSPYAHARILKIDASEALAMPGVLACITGEDLKKAGNLHVASIETCGMVANYGRAREHMQLYITHQVPHVVRTVFALVAGLPEHKIQVIAPDIGGGFGGKVPIYPGYVCCAVASLVLGRPVKWIEDRSENLQADSFARDYHIDAKLALDDNGRMVALKVATLSDCGAADASANPSKFPAGMYSICTGSYDLKAAHVEVDGVYTTKPPGGVAYRCSFRVTEAVHLIERMADIAAHELGRDPADYRLENFIRSQAGFA